MNRALIAAAIVVSSFFSVSSASADPITFSDNFNDGNTNGWWLGYSHHTPSVNGNWRIENGTLVQDAPGDAFIALVQGLMVSTQTISADILPYQVAGYAGFTLWYQNPQNWTSVFLYPGPGVCVVEVLSGAPETFNCLPFFLTQATVHRLSVDVDAVSGQLSISVDNSFVGTYQASNPNRTGLSGLYDGNSGASFDNFELSSTSATAVPEPASLLLLGTGLASLVLVRRRRR